MVILIELYEHYLLLTNVLRVFWQNHKTNIKNVCKRVIHYCRLFKRGGGKNATIRHKGRRPGEMALLIVQVHRKWSGLNAWPDESVIGHRSSDCREEGSPLPLHFSGGWGGRHVFYNVVWYTPPPTYFVHHLFTRV